MANIRPIKDKSGSVTSYQIRVYRGRDVNGKQLKPFSTTWKIPEGMKNSRTIKKEVEKFAAIYEAECKSGLVAPEKKSFAEYSAYVMALKKRDCKPTTYQRYDGMLKRVNEEIGFLKLTDLTSEHLNRLYLKMAQDGQNKINGGGLSDKTIKEHHSLIHSILDHAKKSGLVVVNVADNATPPVVRKKEAGYFELEEVQKIMKCLEKEPLKWRCITMLLIATGARRGEIMGLKWSAVDFTKNTIEIKDNLLRTKEKGTYTDTPKNGKSRYVAVDPSVMKLLVQHRREQAVLRFKKGEFWIDGDFCFTQFNGKPMNPNSITDYLWKFSKKYGLPHIHPHKFRHTQASILIAEKVDPITVSKRLGHKQVSTTQNIYGHLISKAEAEAADTVASVLFQKKA